MSSYEPKDFRIGEPLDPLVAAHIDNLQSVFGAKDGDSRQAYIELQGAIPWIKMQSGAILSASASADYGTTAGDALAKENILFGLNTRTESTDEKGNTSISYNPDAGILPGYEDSTQFGVRPKPGITGMSIQSHNRFGSLRTAVVTFQCWTKEQMDRMEVLYMRPGLTVMLEWGHSKVLKNTTTVSPSDFGLNFFSSKNKMPELIKDIDNKRRQEAYSYDGIVGIIKNFSWSFRPDGGYDCQVHLVTSGDLIESYKANFYLKQSDANIALTEQVNEYLETKPSGSTKIDFPSVFHDSKTPAYPLKEIPELETIYQRFCGSAEAALGNSFEYFKSSLEGLTEDEKLKVFTDLKLNPKLGLAKFLQETEKLFKSLKLIKYGDEIGTVKKGLYFAGQSYYQVVGSPITLKVQAPWPNGVVNLNTVENDFSKGVIKTGFISVLPLKGDYPNLATFTNAVRELHTDKKIGPTRAIGIVMDLLKRGTITQGTESKRLFKFDGNSYFASGAVTRDNRDNKLKVNLIHLENDSKSPDNFYGLSETPTAEDKGGKTLDPAHPSYKFGGTHMLLGARSDGDIVETKAVGTAANSIGPAYFIPLLFTGFEAIEATKTDTSQEVATTDPRTGLPSDESYIDPNDDNLSKLHFILRTKFENPYTSAYLRDSFERANFSAVFQYRQTYALTSEAPPADIEEVFSEKNGGGLRTANLKKYDFDNTTNTYSKQLRAWNLLLGGRFTTANQSPTFNTVYIKLGALLELLNKHVLKSDDNYFFLFKSMYKNAKTTPLYNTMDDHISCDPEICILPHNIDDLKIVGREGLDYLIDPSAPIILNIELGINFILNTLNKYIDANGSVSVLSFIQEILDEISRVCGGINDLQIQYVENSSLFYIVDRQALARHGKDTFPVLNVFGLDSIVRNVSMVSKITPKMSSMIAISAQDTSFTSTQDASGFGAIMNGVTDRIYGDRYDDDKKEKATTGISYDDLRNKLIEDVTDLKVHLRLFYITRTIPPIGKDTQPGVYQNYCNFLTGADSTYRKNSRPTYNFIIPFELQLDLYGLSGMQVMDAFRVNKEILPKTYGGRPDSPIAFLITGVEHSINRGAWTTKVKTQIYNVDDKSPTRDYPEISFKLLEGVSPNYGSGGGGTPKFTGPTNGKVWSTLNDSQRKNAIYLYKAAIEQGFSDTQARAILGVVSKESVFAPVMEDSYMGTNLERLKVLWGYIFKNNPKYPEKDNLKKARELFASETEFLDTVYGYLNPKYGPDMYGNSKPGDGEKYRGGGFNGITFKNTYIKYNKKYAEMGSPGGKVDFATNPALLNKQDSDGIYKVAAYVCLLYFKGTYKNRDSSQEAALLDMFWANAGYGNEGKWVADRKEAFAKATAFVASLPQVIG